MVDAGQRLVDAAWRGDVAEVRRLLEAGVDVNAFTSRHGETGTALFAAAYKDDLGLAEVLLEKGANVNAKTRRGITALHWGVGGGDTGYHLAKLLVEKGAIVNAKNDRGWTPLHYAVRYGSKEKAYFLLEHGAVAVIANNERLTPLDEALKPRFGEPDVALICKMLLPSGALVHLAKNVVDAHEKRQKRIVKGLKRAVDSPGFCSDLADTLAGIDASCCVRGTGGMLVAVFRQRDAFAKGAGDGMGEQAALRARKRQRLGEAYMERRGRHRRAVVAAVQSSDFLSGLAEGLAGVNLVASDPVAPKELMAAALRLDALG